MVSYRRKFTLNLCFPQKGSGKRRQHGENRPPPSYWGLVVACAEWVVVGVQSSARHCIHLVEWNAEKNISFGLVVALEGEAGVMLSHTYLEPQLQPPALPPHCSPPNLSDLVEVQDMSRVGSHRCCGWTSNLMGRRTKAMEWTSSKEVSHHYEDH